jgi:hypothetical protein
MQQRNSRPLVRRLLPHLAMGMNLGSLFALTLIVMDAEQVRATLSSLASPKLAIFTFVMTAALLFAAGASLTGLMLGRNEER